VGGDEDATCSPRAIKRNFQAVGHIIREAGAEVIFSSIIPLVASDIGRNRWIQSINTWLHGWCHQQNSGFFNNEMVYTAPGLLLLDGIVLSQRRKGVCAHELVGLIHRALN